MNERKLSNFCVCMLVFSMFVRVLYATGFDAVLQNLRHTAPASSAAEQASRSSEDVQVWPVQVLQTNVITAPACLSQPPAAFSAQEAASITLSGGCSYQPDKSVLLTQPSKINVTADGPLVLLVHTHSSEAYTQEAGWEYEASDLLRTQDAAHSVIRVGDEIAAVLESHGIGVVHDTAFNDYPTYNGAYARMLTTIESYLQQYPSIQMVIDVHRDAVIDSDGNHLDFTADIDGESCAQLMLVVGTDEGGLEHPDWQENLSNALKLQALLNRSAPGLCRDIDLRTERFNQHATPGSLLLEVGATGNTLAEALRTGRLFAEALAELIGMLAAD